MTYLALFFIVPIVIFLMDWAYNKGVYDTEKRWSDAVNRKHDRDSGL